MQWLENKVYIVTYVYPFIKYGTRKKYKCTDKQKSKGNDSWLLRTRLQNTQIRQADDCDSPFRKVISLIQSRIE